MFPGAHRYDASTSDSLDWVASIFWSQKDSHQSLGLDCHDHGGFRSRNFQNQCLTLYVKSDNVPKFNAIEDFKLNQRLTNANFRGYF